MMLVYWYMIIGVFVGCYMTYLLVHHIGWQELFDDYNQSYKLEERFDLTIDTFKNIMCLIIPVMTAFSWPYFVYLCVRKYFK